jgi:hypothetical protein
MCGTEIIVWIDRLACMAAVIAIVLTAFGLMLGIMKPTAALRRIGIIAGIVVFFTVVPGVLAQVWTGMSVWQQLGVATIGAVTWLFLFPRSRTKSRRKE